MKSRGRHQNCFIISCFFIILNFFRFPFVTYADDKLLRGHTMTDGRILISEVEKFTMGFFSPLWTSRRYLGIWYTNSPPISPVWVANRETPLQDHGGSLTFTADGILVLKNWKDQIIWTSNVTQTSKNSTTVLTDAGDFVIYMERTGRKSMRKLWSSLSDPTDSCVPGQRIYFNPLDKEKHIVTSWKNESDPSRGKHSWGVDPRGAPQMVIWNGVHRHWRSGHWNGVKFIGMATVSSKYQGSFKVAASKTGDRYLVYTSVDNPGQIRFRLSWQGIGLQEEWSDSRLKWISQQSYPVQVCEVYNTCGAFAICNHMGTLQCRCIDGFVPKNHSGGCTRRTELQCGSKRDVFLQVDNVKLPDFVAYIGFEDVNGCGQRCLKNCSCTAYAFVSGIGCMIWTGDLVDLQQLQDGGSPLFVRGVRSELLKDKSRVITVDIEIAAGVTIFALLLIGLICFFARKRQDSLGTSGRILPRSVLEQEASETELAMYSRSDLAEATDNFSEKNKLGEGGFGDVYKGTLPSGRKIAIKRLVGIVDNGLQEFKNEITLIAKLQHRNLVRLLGCCIEGEDRLLLYEYMPNNRLDSYLFDPDKRRLLDWSKRFNIIEGIARGLLYLHRDSRLRVIHRDLKAGNVLLDEDMIPKISDFGRARIYEVNQIEQTTIRVVGTYGYMAPEYAMEGTFSTKSDVYSFGVLLLEIISGKKSTSFRATNYLNITGYAWELWEEGRVMELIDPSVSESRPVEQAIRCTHIGMLCVQEMPSDRPNMETVVWMLESESIEMAEPKRPTFIPMGYEEEMDTSWKGNPILTSSNDPLHPSRGWIPGMETKFQHP